MINCGTYERTLRSAYQALPASDRSLKYEGSITSAALAESDKVTADEFRHIMPFLSNKNFGMIVRYMVVLVKLHWFRTNHHVGTEKDGIAKSLSDALDRALRAMPIEDAHISETDVRIFFSKQLHSYSWSTSATQLLPELIS